MDKIKSHIDEFELYVANIMLSIMIVSSSLQVFFRYVLQNSLTWSEELSRYTYIAFCFFSAAYATTKGAQIAVDLIQLVLRNKKILKIIGAISTIIWLLYSVYFSYLGYVFAYRSSITGETSPAMEIPLWVVYLITPVGLSFMSLRLIQIIYKDIVKHRSSFDTNN